jgi:hypothetical protein
MLALTGFRISRSDRPPSQGALHDRTTAGHSGCRLAQYVAHDLGMHLGSLGVCRRHLDRNFSVFLTPGSSAGGWLHATFRRRRKYAGLMALRAWSRLWPYGAPAGHGPRRGPSRASPDRRATSRDPRAWARLLPGDIRLVSSAPASEPALTPRLGRARGSPTAARRHRPRHAP